MGIFDVSNIKKKLFCVKLDSVIYKIQLLDVKVYLLYQLMTLLKYILLLHKKM